jgi:hypothetical protein
MRWVPVLTIVAAACVTGPSAAQSGSVAIVTVARGEFSGVSDAKEAVVRSTADWTALWRSHMPTEVAPAVDFSTGTVVAVFLGERPTGGFSVEITAIRHDGNTLVVAYTETAPEPRAIVTQVVTSPFHIVKVPQHDGPVRFEKNSANRR